MIETSIPKPYDPTPSTSPASSTYEIPDAKVGRIKRFKDKASEKISNLISKIFSDKKNEAATTSSGLSDRQIKQIDSSSSPLPVNVTSVVDHQRIIENVSAAADEKDLVRIKVNGDFSGLGEMGLSPNLVATMLYNKGLPSSTNAESAENQETKKERIQATLNEINQHIKAEEKIPHYEHKKKVYDEHNKLVTEERYVKVNDKKEIKAKCSSYSWFIDENKQIFIVNEQIAKGGAKRIHQGFCLNNFESVAVISSDIKGHQSGATTKQDLRDTVEGLEGTIKKNMENALLLQRLGVPNLAASPVYGATAEVKAEATGLAKSGRKGPTVNGNRSTYTQTLFDGDASAMVPKGDRKSLSNNEKEKILKVSTAMLESLAAIHDKGYVHLDVKPQNFLMHNGKAYLSDFDGLDKRGTPYNSDIHSITGYYMPPELEGRAKIKLSSSLDSYEMGVSMVNFFFGALGEDQLAFKNMDDAQDPVLAKKNIVEKGLKELGVEGRELKILVDVMSGLIHPDPKERMSCKKAAKLMKRLDV